MEMSKPLPPECRVLLTGVGVVGTSCRRCKKIKPTGGYWGPIRRWWWSNDLCRCRTLYPSGFLSPNPKPVPRSQKKEEAMRQQRMHLTIAMCTDWLKREGEMNKHAPAIRDLLEWATEERSR